MENIIVIGEQERRDGIEYYERIAVRGVILNGLKAFVLKNNKGDYKFPGGGVDAGESHYEALKREVQEETGYILGKIGKEILTAVERRTDIYKERAVFEMTSHYYICQLSDEFVGQDLDDYEAELGFEPIWIELSDILTENLKLIKEVEDVNPWVKREVEVIKYLIGNHL